ncbi:uncharacterized protein [Venturia canescens]|uniref:uncharacterized protein isoform X2 n=1 Tax=Venturia canescens TaxID=32260 RepID=UPI001C9C250F|nr:uncharacterized protein LOC122414548 isoform X2 [Venturia canescens]
MNSTMWNKKKVCLMIVLSCTVIKCQGLHDNFDLVAAAVGLDKEYEDPHSFYKKPREDESYSFVQQISHYIGEDQNSRDHCGPCEEELRLCKINIRNRPLQTDIADELLSRRFVNTILSRAKLVQDGEMFSGHLNMELTVAELQDLREFGEGKLTLRQLDPILNNIIKAPANDPVFETFKFMVDLASVLYSICLSVFFFGMENTEVTTCILATLYVILLLREKRYSLFKLLTFGTVVIFILSFFITWWKLVQNATINHSMLQMKYLEMPEHCRSDASLWSSFWSFFRSSEDCKNYIAARTKNPFLDVTPAQALSHMLSHVIFEPITVMGKAISAFLQSLTANMSPFLGGIVQIAICVSCLPVLVITVILLAGGSLTLGGFGPLSFLSLSGAKKTESERRRAIDSKNERQPIQATKPAVENSSIAAPGRSEMLSLENKHNKLKKKGKITASASEPITNETVGNADDTSSVDNSESECEGQSINVKLCKSGVSDVKESQEIGSGDHA